MLELLTLQITDDLGIDITKMYYRVHSHAKEGINTPKITITNKDNTTIKDKNNINIKSKPKHHNKKYNGKRNGNHDRKNNRQKTPAPDRNAAAIN